MDKQIRSIENDPKKWKKFILWCYREGHILSAEQDPRGLSTYDDMIFKYIEKVSTVFQ